jgi:Niemann-Pick C1 protein
VARSFGDIAGQTILGDVSFFAIGYMLMFGYVTLTLGNFSCVEHRSWLSMVGILGVIMGIVVAYGICSAAGMFYGPMHSVMPFLMLGIGIDDMFVIVQCWDTLTEVQRKETLVKR